jgi:hypothetical protein
VCRREKQGHLLACSGRLLHKFLQEACLDSGADMLKLAPQCLVSHTEGGTKTGGVRE